MTVTVAQQKLVLNSFAAVLESELVSADVVQWKAHDTEMDDRNGLQVIEQVRPRYNVYQTTDGVKDLSGGVDDSAFGSEIYKVNKTFNANMGWGDFVKIRDVGDVRENEALMGAAANLAEQIDAYVLGVAIKAANNHVGTIGTDLASFDDFMSGYTRLKKEGVNDGDMRAVLTFDDKQALGKQLGTLYSDSEASKAIRGGFRGELGGIPTMFTTQLPSLTVGTRAASGAAQVDGASQNVNYADVCTSGAPGQYMTQTLNVKNLTAGHTVKDGEVFTIANSGTTIKAYDNRKGAAHKHAQQFRVIGDYTADGSGLIANMRIFPAIILPSGANTPYATCDAAPANSATITWIGTASTAYTLRGIVQKQAICVDTAQLILPATGTAMRRRLQNVPLSVRMWQHSDFGTGAHSVRFDVALTANVRDRRRICRVNGA
jgi:hypothetical protein